MNDNEMASCTAFNRGWQKALNLTTSALGALLAATVLAACTASTENYEPGSKITESENLTRPEADRAMRPAKVSVDFGAEQGELLHTERFNTWDNDDPAPELRDDDVAFLDKQGLHSDLVRLGFSVDEHCDVATNSCDFSTISAWLHDVSESTDSLMVHLTPEHIMEEKRPPAEARPLLTLAIRELKKLYPKVAYIEATNEPDWEYHGVRIYARKAPILQPDEVYPYYVPFYQAVNEVNKELPASERLQLGGPALTGMTEAWVTAFLDGYAADTNPGKRLDFISYHGYGEFSDDFGDYRPNKPDPSVLSTQRARLDQWLKERQLPEGIPVYITETGIYPGPSFDNKDDPRPDYLRQAAGLASQHYWWARQKSMYPFNWVVRHATQGRKDQLVTHVEEGPQTDTFSPYGNMLLMQSKMKTTKVKASSDALQDGKGVYAVASKDASGASIMVWNYQHINNVRFRATIDVTGLPPGLTNKPVRQAVYRIDQTTSNYWADPEAANLQMVSESVVEPGESYTLAIDLSVNALALIVLEPAK